MKKPRKNTIKVPALKEPEVAYRARQPKTVGVHELLKIQSGSVSDPLKRVETFRKGLPKRSLERLKEVSGLDFNMLSIALSVSTKTLQRKEVFDAVQSEKMYELASLYATGINYFGEEGFRRWMERPLFTIGNRKPLDLIDMSEGITLLKTEILRLQHGIAV